MPADEEKQVLLKTEHNSFLSYAKTATPEFGEVEWWILNISCLLTITLLSAWQVTGKVAMSLNLDSPEVRLP